MRVMREHDRRRRAAPEDTTLDHAINGLVTTRPLSKKNNTPGSAKCALFPIAPRTDREGASPPVVTRNQRQARLVMMVEPLWLILIETTQQTNG